MLPSFPKKVTLRKVIPVIVLVLVALLTGILLSVRNANNPNLHMTPIFAATSTPR